MTVYRATDFVTADEKAKFQGLADKPGTDLHQALSDYIAEVSGIEVTPKQVQALLSIHGTFQKSGANKNRADYRARTVQSIGRGGKTTAERYLEDDDAEVQAEDVLDGEVVSVQEDAVETVAIEAPKVEAPKSTRRTRKAKAAA